MTTASLHVVSSDARRGAETFAVDLAAGLCAQGHPARVVALRPSGTAEAHDVPALGSGRRSIATLRALRSAAREVDVVAAHGSATLEACAIGLAGMRVPFVYRTIGDPAYWVSSATRRRAVGWMLGRAGGNVVLWPAARARLVSIYSIPVGRIEVIPNAVAAERFGLTDAPTRERARQRLGVPAGQPCLGFVGSLSPEKDVGTLLRALRHLDGVHLLVAGDGPERRRLESLVTDVAQGRVDFLGTIRDPSDVYAAADLLVLPSLSEGMPAVVIEAGLVGTPSVASEVGAVPDMIEDGRTGFLVPPRDERALVAAVQAALPKARDVGLRAAEAFRDRYTMEQVVPPWAATLERARRR